VNNLLTYIAELYNMGYVFKLGQKKVRNPHTFPGSQVYQVVKINDIILTNGEDEAIFISGVLGVVEELDIFLGIMTGRRSNTRLYDEEMLGRIEFKRKEILAKRASTTKKAKGRNHEAEKSKAKDNTRVAEVDKLAVEAWV